VSPGVEAGRSAASPVDRHGERFLLIVLRPGDVELAGALVRLAAAALLALDRPPAVRVGVRDVEGGSVAGPRAACSSERPRRSVDTQRSPCFLDERLSAA
jgi:hypothetical protein